MTEAVAADWTESVVYRDLVARPELRALIDAAAARHKPGMSAADFLGGADQLLKLAGGGVPLKLIAEVAAPLYAQMGVKTGKTVTRRLALPPGRAIVAALTALASRGQTLKAARQGEDGVVLEAVLPSDAFAFEGSLIVALGRDGSGTMIEAATRVPGQMFDWGKSGRTLNALFDDIDGLATLQP
jgi:hypothetical protein